MKQRRFRFGGYTLVETVVATTVLALCAVGVTQSLLQLNRRAAVSRILNAAKAEALSRIQQVQQLSYDPDANPAVVPTLLQLQSKVTTVDLGSTLTDLGSIPATETWTVTQTTNNPDILTVRCKVEFKYMNMPRSQSYEVFTYKAPN